MTRDGVKMIGMCFGFGLAVSVGFSGTSSAYVQGLGYAALLVAVVCLVAFVAAKPRPEPEDGMVGAVPLEETPDRVPVVFPAAFADRVTEIYRARSPESVVREPPRLSLVDEPHRAAISEGEVFADGLLGDYSRRVALCGDPSQVVPALLAVAAGCLDEHDAAGFARLAQVAHRVLRYHGRSSREATAEASRILHGLV